jgi:hypothetical protein
MKKRQKQEEKGNSSEGGKIDVPLAELLQKRILQFGPVFQGILRKRPE